MFRERSRVFGAFWKRASVLRHYLREPGIQLNIPLCCCDCSGLSDHFQGEKEKEKRGNNTNKKKGRKTREHPNHFLTPGRQIIILLGQKHGGWLPPQDVSDFATFYLEFDKRNLVFPCVFFCVCLRSPRGQLCLWDRVLL